MTRPEIGFIGAGRMAEALIGGVIASKVAKPGDIIVSDRDAARVKHVTKKYGVRSESTNARLVLQSGIVILAVKPDNIATVLDEIKDTIDESKIVVSIAAGITEEYISTRLSRDIRTRIVRVMPNTPAMIKEGATGIYFNENCPKESTKSIMKIFDSVGTSIVFEKESMLDAVTALSGSGPAYVFYFMEALGDAGVSVGLSRDDSQKLALQTVLGAARMAKETNLHPTILKEMVTSPGGTTIAALKVLEKDGVKGSIIEAVNKACKRSKKLSKS